MKEEKTFSLRKLEEKDLLIRAEWISNPLVYNSMNLPPHITYEQTKEWYKRVNNNKFRVDFVLELNHNIIAMSGLIGESNESAEIYTFTNPFLQSKGIGTICSYLSLFYGLKLFNLEFVISKVDSDNIRSIKIWEKLGFKLQKIIRDGIVKNGQPIDRLVYKCDIENFKSKLYDVSIDEDNTLTITQ